MGGHPAEDEEGGSEEGCVELEEGEVEGGGHHQGSEKIVPETEVHPFFLDLVDGENVGVAQVLVGDQATCLLVLYFELQELVLLGTS